MTEVDYSQENTGGNEGGNEGGNPNWGPLLADIPQEFHSKVTPHLQNWDRGIQQRFQENAAWKPVQSSGMSPEMVQQAIQLARSMQEDPRGVYDAMGQHYNFQQAVQQAVAQQQEDDSDNPYAQRFTDYDNRMSQLAGQNEVLAKAIMAQYEKQQSAAKEAEEDAALEKEIKAAKQKYGDAWNEQIALKMMQGFNSPSEAMEFFLNQGRQQPPHAPRLLGSGSTFPQLGNKRPGQMNDQEQQLLVTQRLMDAMRANNQ